jgi:S1-C subfamily serine protease
MPVNGGMGGMGQMVIVMGGPNGGKELAKEDLAPVLSPTQLEQFERRKKQAAQGPLGMINKAQPGFGKKNNDKGISSPLGFDFKEDAKGLRVTKVEADSRADRAGLLVDDIVDSVNDKPIDNSVQLRRALALLPSKAFQMTVKRGDEVTTLTFEKKN